VVEQLLASQKGLSSMAGQLVRRFVSWLVGQLVLLGSQSLSSYPTGYIVFLLNGHPVDVV
jgi:hypothetical protein